MKKVVLSIVLTFALALGIVTPAQAADALPVFVEGQKIAEPAQVKNNTSYLPMRAIYEALGAKVDWDAKNQRVIATEPGGAWTEIPLNGGYMTVRYSASEKTQADLAGRRPFAEDGRVYLPVRLVADTLGYQVDYNGQRVEITEPKLTYKDDESGLYTLNLLNGELKNARQGGAQRIGRVDMFDKRGFSVAKLDSFRVEMTQNENYLFRGNAYPTGELLHIINVYAWFSRADRPSVTVCPASQWDPLPEPFWVGDMLWLSDDRNIFAIDDSTDKITQYKSTDIYGADYTGLARCYWADGRFMLVGSGADFDIYDVKNQKLTDLQTAMLEPDTRAQVQAFMQQNSWGTKTPEQFERLWQHLGNSFAAIPGGDEAIYLRFVKAVNNVLYFDLVVHYWAIDDNGGIAGEKDKTFSVTYTLPQ